MLAIVGIVCVIGLVFGGYALAGGKFAIIIKALPFEFMMIGGCATGVFLIANGSSILKGSLSDLKRVFSGAQWNKKDYEDVLCLMYMVIKVLKTKGVLALEPHVDNPHESTLFARFPKIQHDHFALDFMADTLRMMTMSMDDPYQVEDCMQRQLKKHHNEMHARSAALQNIADSLPAIGIVAAVLGIIKTMASIDQPVEVLGGLIGGALVGTFLGVYLAYGFVAPMTARLNQTYEQDHQFYFIIRDCLVAYLQGHSAPIAVELARGNVPTEHQPSFHDLDKLVNELPGDPLAA